MINLENRLSTTEASIRDAGLPQPAVVHPLDPLTGDEIRTAASIVRQAVDNPATLRIEIIELLEPARAVVRAFAAGDTIQRQARVNVYRIGSIGVEAFIVSLSDGSVLARTRHATARPTIQLEEFEEIEQAVKRHPDFIAACKRRGIADPEQVCVDPWSAGSLPAADEQDKHISYAFCWHRPTIGENQYAHPIEGLNPVIDIKNLTVLRIEDHGDTPVPAIPANYTEGAYGSPRSDLKPIDVEQPQGVSFSINNRCIQWHDWSIHVGFNAREGLTLHNMSFAGRSVLYRAALAEMVVPYGSPLPNHARKSVFDIGEYGIGKLCNSLALGCDCLGVIHYMDALMSDINGEPMKIDNAICIHEEDDGILWKHYDFRTENTEVRRARRLVISTIATVGNYEYGSYWYFHMDGSIEFEMKATGIINTAACVPGTPQKYGLEVAPGVVGQMHQHLFCAKLDMAIDGDNNSVIECDTIVEPEGPDNPYGNAFYQRETRLSEQCGRPRDPDAERYWKFVSADGRNAMGHPTAYKLESSGAVRSFVRPDSPTGKRMGFTYNQLWITADDAQQRYPAGEFVNQSDGSDGLAVWTKEARSIDGVPLVAWPVFGINHMPRLEDYPVQPVVRTGFKLHPAGFFDRNPALDLPAETNASSCHAAVE